MNGQDLGKVLWNPWLRALWADVELKMYYMTVTVIMFPFIALECHCLMIQVSNSVCLFHALNTIGKATATDVPYKQTCSQAEGARGFPGWLLSAGLCLCLSLGFPKLVLQPPTGWGYGNILPGICVERRPSAPRQRWEVAPGESTCILKRKHTGLHHLPLPARRVWE